MENLVDILIIALAYCAPLILGLFAMWVYRSVTKKDNYSRDFIPGLIMVCATREFLRNFRFRRRR